VLLAPLVAVALAWVAWRCNETVPGGARGEGGRPPLAPAQPAPR
jgi:hypothetical protein